MKQQERESVWEDVMSRSLVSTLYFVQDQAAVLHGQGWT